MRSIFTDCHIFGGLSGVVRFAELGCCHSSQRTAPSCFAEGASFTTISGLRGYFAHRILRY